MGQLSMPSQIVSWSDTAITITVPQVGLASAATAKFVVLRADGSLAKETQFQMVAGK